MKRGPERRGGGPPQAGLIRELVRASGGLRDPEVRELITRARSDRIATRQRIADARDAVREAVLAEPYDETRLREALDALQNETSAAQDHAQNVLVKLAAQMGAEERKALREGQPDLSDPPGPGPEPADDDL